MYLISVYFNANKWTLEKSCLEELEIFVGVEDALIFFGPFFKKKKNIPCFFWEWINGIGSL